MRFFAVLFFLLAAFMLLLVFRLGPFGFVPLALAVPLVGIGTYMWQQKNERNRPLNLARTGDRVRYVFRFFGRFMSGLCFGLPFVGLMLLSAIPYGGGNKTFILFFWLAILGGFLWAVAGLFDVEYNGSGRDELPSEITTPTYTGPLSTIQGDPQNSDREQSTSSVIAEPKRDQAISEESLPILEATDVQRFLAAASHSRIRKAHSDLASVTQFFNAIRYGQMETVRRVVSANPLLVLARDSYGNTALEAAMQEKNSELQAFFKACLAKA